MRSFYTRMNRWWKNGATAVALLENLVERGIDPARRLHFCPAQQLLYYGHLSPGRPLALPAGH